MDDFSNLLATHPKMNVTHFRNDVEHIKQKFDNIFNGTKIPYENKEEFWKYIFAVKIIPIRNAYFKDWKKSILDHRLQTDPDFKIRYLNYQIHKEMDDWLEEERKSIMEEALRNAEKRLKEALAFHDSIRIDAMRILGIGAEEALTKELVLSQFRIIAKAVHPDFHMGQGEEYKIKFQELLEARDTLLNHLART
jgi:hypothetical protein